MGKRRWIMPSKNHSDNVIVWSMKAWSWRIKYLVGVLTKSGKPGSDFLKWPWARHLYPLKTSKVSSISECYLLWMPSKVAPGYLFQATVLAFSINFETFLLLLLLLRTILQVITWHLLYLFQIQQKKKSGTRISRTLLLLYVFSGSYKQTSKSLRIIYLAYKFMVA